MSTRKKILLAVAGVYIAAMFIVILIFGATRRDNEEFAPQNEFKTDTWIALPGPFDFNKAVLYLLIAGLLTVVTMLYIANRMQARPNRVQTAVETLYTLMRDNITRGNMDDAMARKWFPFIGTLFLIVFVAYNVEGIRVKGLGGYLKSLVPAGISGGAAIPIFVLEFLSNFMRLLSLSVRLFANILAGHLIILFMSGGLAVLLGLEVLGVFTLPFGIALFLFEVGLVATLQAFIFATLSAIYLGGAVAEHH